MSALEEAVESTIKAAESGSPEALEAAVTAQQGVMQTIEQKKITAIPNFVTRLSALRDRNDLAGRRLSVALAGVRRRRAAMSSLISGGTQTYGRNGQIV
ncbi:hypothetical protein KCG44_09455 [Pacificimonas sp. WHA3]|uniref:Uncharacterized protein n=1 Tax=Pacificimonas pallii TaxID=2827236 RepID=A0ABS6SF21_9SPHN|nr:hypothetical protein [Pacificimonas pallii]MBV7257008.1 hypothetical protein [Pacificimonas pallii]